MTQIARHLSTLLPLYAGVLLSLPCTAVPTDPGNPNTTQGESFSRYFGWSVEIAIDRRGDVFRLVALERPAGADPMAENYYELLKFAAANGEVLWHRRISRKDTGNPAQLQLDCAGNPIVYSVEHNAALRTDTAKFLVISGKDGKLVCSRKLQAADIVGDAARKPVQFAVPWGKGENGHDPAGGFYILLVNPLDPNSFDLTKETILCRFDPVSGQTTHRIPLGIPQVLMQRTPLLRFALAIEPVRGDSLVAIMSGVMGEREKFNDWNYYYAFSQFDLSGGTPRWTHRFVEPVRWQAQEIQRYYSIRPDGGAWFRGGTTGWSSLDGAGKVTTGSDASPHLLDEFLCGGLHGRVCDAEGAIMLSFTTKTEDPKTGFIHGVRKYNPQGKLVWTSPANLAKGRIEQLFMDADDNILALESLSNDYGQNSGSTGRIFRLDRKTGLPLQTLDLGREHFMDWSPTQLKVRDLLVSTVQGRSKMVAINTKKLRPVWEVELSKGATFTPDEVIKLDGPKSDPGKIIAWYSKDGRMAEGEFVGVRDGTLVFSSVDAKEKRVALDKLSRESRQLAELLAAVGSVAK